MSPSASEAAIDLHTPPRPPLAAVPPLPPATPAAAAAPMPWAGRWILHERLAGDAARERAQRATPDGAGLSREEARDVEYVEVWGTPGDTSGFDFRMYNFGGALVAQRST